MMGADTVRTKSERKTPRGDDARTVSAPGSVSYFTFICSWRASYPPTTAGFLDPCRYTDGIRYHDCTHEKTTHRHKDIGVFGMGGRTRLFGIVGQLHTERESSRVVVSRLGASDHCSAPPTSESTRPRTRSGHSVGRCFYFHLLF